FGWSERQQGRLTMIGTDGDAARTSDAIRLRLMSEELVLLKDARKLFPRRPSKETLWQWALGRGVRGHRLETILIGSNRYTSRQAADRLVAAINADDDA